MSRPSVGISVAPNTILDPGENTAEKTYIRDTGDRTFLLRSIRSTTEVPDTSALGGLFKATPSSRRTQLWEQISVVPRPHPSSNRGEESSDASAPPLPFGKGSMSMSSASQFGGSAPQ